MTYLRSTPAKSLRKTLVFGGALALMLGFGPVALAALPTVALPGTQAFPESITSTPDGTLYTGSIGAGGVYRTAPGASRAKLWIKPGAMGSHSTFGVLADAASGTLWVCSNNLSALGIGPSVNSDETGAWLKGFDLKTGKGKVSAKLPGQHAFCNDMAVGKDGSVYVADSGNPHILKLSANKKQLQVWATDARFKPSQPPPKATGLDGIVVAENGDVYVDTYSAGEFFRVAVKDGKAGTVTRLEPSRKLVLPDALRHLSGNSFLLIEGGGRLDRATIKGDTVEIHTIKGGFHIPTGATLVDGTAWVSEGQLGYLFNPNKKGGPRLPFHVYGIALSGYVAGHQ